MRWNERGREKNGQVARRKIVLKWPHVHGKRLRRDADDNDAADYDNKLNNAHILHHISIANRRPFDTVVHYERWVSDIGCRKRS